jgi:uncharacterized protein
MLHPRHLGPPLELKSVRADGTFEGYASLFNSEDLGHDVILPGAFTDSLKKRSAAGIKLLYQHDPAEPIGVWDSIREDAKGLYARGRLLLSVSRAREVHALLEAGALDGLSIGFKAITARRENKSGIRRISKVDLWEISVVTFPMMPEARVSALKRTLPPPLRRSSREFETWLTAEGKLTKSEARAFLSHGLRGLHALDAANGSARLSAAIRDATRALQR